MEETFRGTKISNISHISNDVKISMQFLWSEDYKRGIQLVAEKMT